MVKKTLILITVCITLAVISSPAFSGGSKRDVVPMVAYLSPDNDSVADLTGKTSLEFKWKNGPVPGGGRDSYKFRLIRGFKYDFIVSEELAQGVFSINVPADKFEDGITYSWYVEQRDASLMVWSRHDSWSFKVIKR